MTAPRRGKAEDLGRRGYSRAALADRVVEHAGHPRCARRARDRSGIGTSTDQLAHVLGCLENLKHAGAASIAGPAAALASAALVHELSSLQTEHRVARVCCQIGWHEPALDFAALTENANEPLGNHRPQCRLEPGVFDLDVQQ